MKAGAPASSVMESIHVDSVVVDGRRRPLDEEAVSKLMKSIHQIGLQTPITVRNQEDREGVRDRYILITGAHRLAAARRVGLEKINAFVVEDGWVSSSLWEIAENLHRAELTAQERAEQIAKWVALVKEEGVSAQTEPKLRSGRPESGVRAASRELGLDRSEVRRSLLIAGISPEAKEAARRAQLDNNQSALLKVASVASEEQLASVQQLTAAHGRAELQPNHVLPAIRRFSKFCASSGAAASATKINEAEIDEVRLCIALIDEWLAHFVGKLDADTRNTPQR